LTGLAERDSVLAFDPSEGWVEFLSVPSPMDAVWEGRLPLGRGRDVKELDSWLAARSGRSVVRLGYGEDTPDGGRAKELEQRTLEARRPKDAAELEVMRRAVAATAAGFEAGGRLRSGPSGIGGRG
jgi:hypothetical protein